MNSSPHMEGQLEITVPDGRVWEVLDRQGVQLPSGLSLVDGVLDLARITLLVEIKDPSETTAPQRARDGFAAELKGDAYICDRLVPKARDSYTYLHLMSRDERPFVFVVLLGLDAYTDPALLLAGFKERLRARLGQETDVPWAKQYLQDCAVVTVEMWNRVYPEMPIRRVSAD